MCSEADSLLVAQQHLLDKLGGHSLQELAQSLPSAYTTDIHVLAAEEYLAQAGGAGEEEQELLWKAFHQLSLSHSTLFHHRHQQKLLRQSRSAKMCKKGIKQQQPQQERHTALQLQDTKDMITSLPEDWVVVQVSHGVDSTGGAGWGATGRLLQTAPTQHILHIARVSAGGEPSVVLQSIHNCSELLLEEMERIKQQNKVLNKDYADNVTKYAVMRDQLDARLKSVVQGMESSWLGVWRCLLQGSIPNSRQLLSVVRKAAQHVKEVLTEQQLHKLLLAMCSPAVQLSAHSRDSETASLLHSAFNCQLRAVVGAVLGDSVRSSRVQQLCGALQGCQDAFREARRANRGPVILLLDKSVVSLPWEALPCLRDQPVTRMPSLHSLHALYQTQKQDSSSILHRGADCTNGYYLLDPEGNLPRTQQRLSAAFTATGWPGMCAAKPSHQQFREALTTADVFVYVGHGSGSQYLPGDLVEEVQCRAAVLLYGCSSVRLQPRGRVPDPWGVLLNYLLANCPTVLGMLWEVTDKDTDLLTGNMLEVMAAARQGAMALPRDLPGIVARSRHLCKRYMTACAITVYGLPISFRIADGGSS